MAERKEGQPLCPPSPPRRAMLPRPQGRGEGGMQHCPGHREQPQNRPPGREVLLCRQLPEGLEPSALERVPSTGTELQQATAYSPSRGVGGV